MQIIADLHIHSKYSRAVSQKMDLYEIASCASIKGIHLVSTSDWTHPLWFRHITDNLKEVNSGIFQLKNNQQKNVYFILTTEISSIYNQGNKLRRIHNLVFSPSVATAEKVIKKLTNEGAKLLSDGRPIIGISSKDLLTMLLEIDKNIFLVPCHAWTPWFSLYGSKSGFDLIDECFGELAHEIYAIETGLSSDPIMNWQIKELDNRAIISSSDAHSGPKLGREATVFVPMNNEPLTMNKMTYNDIVNAIKQDPNGRLKIGYTIEFFPEEGKYHWTGHRACNIRYNPLEVREKGVICPVCHKPLTVGVENRVFDLSHQLLDRQNDIIYLQNKAGLTFVYDKEKKRKPFVSLIPLLEILLEVNNGSNVQAMQQYNNLTINFSEFDILMRTAYEDIAKHGGDKLAEAIRIVRERRAFVDPGYDGVFGTVKIFNQNEKKDNSITQASQESLF